jgi:CRP-like cAMP-binding protein
VIEQSQSTEVNRLLRAIPADAYARLIAGSDVVTLEREDLVYKPHQPIQRVYFPSDMILSVVSVMDNGDRVEVGTVGNEGMGGLPAFLESDSSPYTVFVQVSGEVRVLDADLLMDVAQSSPETRTILHRYTQSCLNQSAQSAACNRMHSIEERCARWLLMTHDRVGKDTFDLTQEFLADMLGVRRAGVTVVCGALQRAGFIRYRRGHIAILDRAKLEEVACECYERVRTEVDRLVGPPPVRGELVAAGDGRR